MSNWTAPEHDLHGLSPTARVMEASLLSPQLVVDGTMHTDNHGIHDVSNDYVENERFGEEYPLSMGVRPLLGHKRCFWEIHTFTNKAGENERKWIFHDFRDERIIGERDSDRFESLWDSPLMEEITIIMQDGHGGWKPCHDFGELPSKDSEKHVLVVGEIVDEIQHTETSRVEGNRRKRQKELDTEYKAWKKNQLSQQLAEVREEARVSVLLAKNWDKSGVIKVDRLAS